MKTIIEKVTFEFSKEEAKYFCDFICCFRSLMVSYRRNKESLVTIKSQLPDGILDEFDDLDKLYLHELFPILNSMEIFR